MAIHLPPLRADYLKASTDDTGIFQHAKYCIPKRNEGYTTDDNARALVACARYQRLKNDREMEALARVYLAFLNHMQRPDGDFHNYLSYERTFLDYTCSDDCMGRVLWACGCVLNSPLPKFMKMVAKDIYDKDLPWVWRTLSPRFLAHAILGTTQHYQVSHDDNAKTDTEKIADILVKLYVDQAKDDWHWFESTLTYDNARMTQALFEAYAVTGKPKHLEVAKESMDFLVKTQMLDGVFVPIGNDGWYRHGEKRPIYDQQPLEATAMVEAAVDAFTATKEKSYVQLANTAFEWFLGRNTRKIQMFSPETNGCFDGLAREKVNMNQGAESSICYLLARLKLEELKRGT